MEASGYFACMLLKDKSKQRSTHEFNSNDFKTRFDEGTRMMKGRETRYKVVYGDNVELEAPTRNFII